MFPLSFRVYMKCFNSLFVLTLVEFVDQTAAMCD